MKSKQRILVILILLLTFTTIGWGQSKSYAKLQQGVSYEQYEKTWYKSAISTLKASKRDTKSINKRKKIGKKRANKLNKYREQISNLNARKEGSDE